MQTQRGGRGRLFSRGARGRLPRAICVAPTRELAKQVLTVVMVVVVAAVVVGFVFFLLWLLSFRGVFVGVRG